MTIMAVYGYSEVGCTGEEGFISSLGGSYKHNGRDNVDVGEDSNDEREDKNDSTQSEVQ